MSTPPPSERLDAERRAKLRDALINRHGWAMIARGQLFTQGWRLAVLEGFKADGSWACSCAPIPPGVPAPAGTVEYTWAPPED